MLCYMLLATAIDCNSINHMPFIINLLTNFCHRHAQFCMSAVGLELHPTF